MVLTIMGYIKSHDFTRFRAFKITCIHVVPGDMERMFVLDEASAWRSTSVHSRTILGMGMIERGIAMPTSSAMATIFWDGLLIASVQSQCFVFLVVSVCASLLSDLSSSHWEPWVVLIG